MSLCVLCCLLMCGTPLSQWGNGIILVEICRHYRGKPEMSDVTRYRSRFYSRCFCYLRKKIYTTIEPFLAQKIIRDAPAQSPTYYSVLMLYAPE